MINRELWPAAFFLIFGWAMYAFTKDWSYIAFNFAWAFLFMVDRLINAIINSSGDTDRSKG